jgi:hypothetical protein
MHPDEIRVICRHVNLGKIVQRLPEPAGNAKVNSGHSCVARYTVIGASWKSSIATTRNHLLQGKSFLTALRREATFTRVSPNRAISLDGG